MIRWLCRVGWHRWRYHGFPDPERRICCGCLRRQHLWQGTWRWSQ